MYNSQFDLVDKLEEEGSIFVIRLVNPVNVNPIEKDTNKLQALYHEGYECARRVNELSF